MTAELSALAATNRPHPKTTNARSPQPQGKAPRSTTRSTIIEAQAADVMARSMTIIDKTTSCDDLVEACPPPFPTTSSHHDDWRFFPQDMPRECLLHCLTYLKAMELSALTQTCTLLNDHTLLQDALGSRMTKYAADIGGSKGSSVSTPTASRRKGGNGKSSPTTTTDSVMNAGTYLEQCRFLEVQYLHKLLSAPEPASGYYISKSWASWHRRFAEAMVMRRKSLNKRKSLIRERRDSDVVPDGNITLDITCAHGCLKPINKGQPNAASSGFAKRRVVDKRTWRVICCYYGGGVSFRTSTEECSECCRGEREEKDRLEQEKRLRDQERTSSPLLNRLFNRRIGTPTVQGLAPLDPGLYHLVPRSWLSSWRNYLKDPKQARPLPPDSTLLLCEAHGLALIPPHVGDFLVGEKRGLLSNLSGRTGTICEVLTTEEWDEVTRLYPTDFTLKLAVDPDDLGFVTWSTPPCELCDPAYDCHEVTVRSRQRKWAV